MPDFLIAWADPSAAAHYSEASLSPEDARRAVRPRSLKAQRDWEVSRALLQTFREKAAARVHSLSHSHGHAICGFAPAGGRIGVDIERIKPRDVLALADWVCSPYEKRELRHLSGFRQLQHFYMLWTLKEAFIKAAGLGFPADMSKVGLKEGAAGEDVLNAPLALGPWRAYAWQLRAGGGDWVAASVWQASGGGEARPVWRTMPVCALPQRTLLGAWQCP